MVKLVIHIPLNYRLNCLKSCCHQSLSIISSTFLRMVDTLKIYKNFPYNAIQKKHTTKPQIVQEFL